MAGESGMADPAREVVSASLSPTTTVTDSRFYS